MNSVKPPTLKERIEAAKAQYPLESIVAQTTGETRFTHNLNCPFHSDSKPSLHVYPDGHWKCFGCGKSGDQLDWLGYLQFGEGYNPSEHLREVIDSLGALNIQAAPRIERKPEQPRPTIDGGIPDRLMQNIGEREISYWQAQGIPYHALVAFRVGFTGNRYTFGWTYRGVLTAVKMRRDDDLYPDLEPKYISLKGSRYSQPYNIDAVILPSSPPPVVIICEDEKSVLAAAACGLVAIAAPASAKWDSWLTMLSGVNRIILVPDNDTAGQQVTAELLKLRRSIEVFNAPVGKDLFDYHDWLYNDLAGDRVSINAMMKSWLEIE